MLDRYNRLPYKYQSKIGFDTLIQNVILKELTKIMGSTITDLEIEMERKISRKKYLENKKHFEENRFCKWLILVNMFMITLNWMKHVKSYKIL